MDETNPYASPACDESVASDQQPPGRPAWREGDVLVAPAKNAVLPRACVLSNRSRGVWRRPVTVFQDWTAWVLLPLVLVPFVGLFCVAIGGQLLLRMGWAAEVRLCYRRSFALAFVVCELTACILTLLANILTGAALLLQEIFPLALGLVCHGVAVALVSVPLLVFTRLRPELLDRGLVRIRGVHSGYLDRLPQQDSWQESLGTQELPQD